MSDDEERALENCPWCGSADVTPITNDDEEIDYNEDDQAITTQPMFRCNYCHNVFMEMRTYGTVVITQGYYDDSDYDENFTMFYGVPPFEYDYHQRNHPEKCKTPSMVRMERERAKSALKNYDPDLVSSSPSPSGYNGGYDPDLVSDATSTRNGGYDPDLVSFNKKSKAKKKSKGAPLVKLKRPVVSRRTSKN